MGSTAQKRRTRLASLGFERLQASKAAAALTAVRNGLVPQADGTLQWAGTPEPKIYLLPLERLWGTQSMVRLDRFVEPPLDQAVT